MSRFQAQALDAIACSTCDGSFDLAALDACEPLVRCLVRATEYRDPYTAGHQANVRTLTIKIAQMLGLSKTEVALAGLGAALHDIGKIAVPAEILTKPGRLSAPEWEIMKSHTLAGFEILAGAGLPEQISDIVVHHHERLDGSGYPHRLSGSAIRREARIVAVADVIDAITSHRPYRPSLGLDVALETVAAGSGRLFDAEVVAAALEVATER